MIKIVLHIAILLSFLWCTSIFAENDSLIPIMVDGANTIRINQEYPYSTINTGQLDDSDFTTDVFTEILETDTADTSLKGVFVVSSGSESNKLIKNKDETWQSAMYNHNTTVIAAISLPDIPFDIFFGYNYLNCHTDRFSRMWKNYDNYAGKNIIALDDGLLSELVTGYRLKLQAVETYITTKSYSRWTPAPFYYTPLFTSGFRISPKFLFTFANSKIQCDLNFDQSKTYYLLDEFKQFSDRIWTISWKRRFANGVTTEIAHVSDTRYEPNGYIKTSADGMLGDYLHWNLSGNGYHNFRAAIHAGLDFTMIPTITLHIDGGFDYHPAKRDFTYLRDNLKPVIYETIDYETATFHTSVQYSDTLFFPAMLKVWYDYHQNSLWEFIRYNGSTTYVTEKIYDNGAKHNGGAKGSYSIRYKKFSTTLWGNVILTPSEYEQQLSLPRNLGCDIAWNTPDKNQFYAAILFEYRDRMVTRYRIESEWNESTYELITKPQSLLSLSLQVPFKIPVICKHLSTAFRIDAGPINLFGDGELLTKEQEQLHYPLGTVIGPTITAKINGYIF